MSLEKKGGREREGQRNRLVMSSGTPVWHELGQPQPTWSKPASPP